MLHLIIDLVFMVGGFIFAFALIKTIIKKVKMPVETSLTTAIVLTAFVGGYIVKDLYLAAIATSLTAICWYILYFKR